MRYFLVVASLIVFTGCETGSGRTDRPVVLSFSFQGMNSQWKGGDVALSIVLNEERTLWFFGDTLITDPGIENRDDFRVAHNSLAVQMGDDFEFYWGNGGFFGPFSAETRNWVLGGIYLQDVLYLFAVEVNLDDWIEIVDNFMYKISNPLDDPEDWVVSVIDIDGLYSMGASVILHGDSVYIYGHVSDEQDIFYAVSSIEDFEFPSRWVYGEEPVFSHGASEMTIFFDEFLQEFLMVYMNYGMGDTIVLRRSQHPEGPFTDPEVLYVAPDMSLNAGYITYAARAHPQFNDFLTLSYCTNTFTYSDYFEDLDLYYPTFVAVDIPKRN